MQIDNWFETIKKSLSRDEQLKDQNIKTICMFYCLSKKNTCQDQIGSFICYALTTMFVAQRRKRGKPLPIFDKIFFGSVFICL